MKKNWKELLTAVVGVILLVCLVVFVQREYSRTLKVFDQRDWPSRQIISFSYVGDRAEKVAYDMADTYLRGIGKQELLYSWRVERPIDYSGSYPQNRNAVLILLQKVRTGYVLTSSSLEQKPPADFPGKQMEDLVQMLGELEDVMSDARRADTEEVGKICDERFNKLHKDGLQLVEKVSVDAQGLFVTTSLRLAKDWPGISETDAKTIETMNDSVERRSEAVALLQKIINEKVAEHIKESGKKPANYGEYLKWYSDHPATALIFRDRLSGTSMSAR